MTTRHPLTAEQRALLDSWAPHDFASARRTLAGLPCEAAYKAPFSAALLAAENRQQARGWLLVYRLGQRPMPPVALSRHPEGVYRSGSAWHAEQTALFCQKVVEGAEDVLRQNSWCDVLETLRDGQMRSYARAAAWN